MRKRFSGRLSLIIIMLFFTHYYRISSFAQENITPIDKVDWINDENNDGDLSEEEETSVEEELTESEELTTISEGSPLDTSSYVAFLSSLQNTESRVFEYITFVTEGEMLTTLYHNIYKNGNQYYVTQLFPPFLPKTEIIESNRQEIATGYLSVDDLIINAADGLNQQPQIYVGSAVEDLYSFSQENYDTLEGKFIQVSTDSLQLVNLSLEMFRLEDYFFKVLTEWFSMDLVIDNMIETDLGLQVDLINEPGQAFNELANKYRPDFPELDSFFEEYPDGFQGTVMINYDNSLIGLGLISEANEEYAAGSEIYIEYQEETPTEITADNIMTDNEFTDLIGYDILTEIFEFEDSLNADQFVPVGVEE